jgi:hypothetical protein
MNISKYCLSLLFLSLGTLINAQSCLENLFKANKFLDAGNIDQCISLVTPCCDISNDESVRWQAYRLKSISYILKGKTDSAKIAAENMLDINPTYTTNLLKDPKEFINLVKSVVVIPKFTIGLAFSAGSNTSFPEISKGYVVSDYTKTYTSRSGLQFGTNLGFYLNPSWVVELGIISTTKKFDINFPFNNWKVSVKEKLNYLDVPLSVKYIIMPKNKLRFFAQAGVFSGYLLYAYNDFKSTYIPQQQDYTLTKLNIIDRRNRWNFGLIGGLGAYYKLKTGHMSVYANYFRSFTKINKAEKRYEYPEQIFTYYFVDDDITLHNISLSLGYTHYLNYKVYRGKI